MLRLSRSFSARPDRAPGRFGWAEVFALAAAAVLIVAQVALTLWR